MSVSSDFWTGDEPKSSSALRLAQSFRRASTATTSVPAGSLQDEQLQRRPTFGTIEPSRKSSFTGLSLRLTRSRSKPLDQVQEDKTASSPSKNLGDRFFSLPNEIQVHILSHLSALDILSVRLSSHVLSDILSLNATTISHSILYQCISGDTPLYLETLYPLPRPQSDLSYLLQMLHRQATVTKMVTAVTDFIQFKIYRIRSPSRQRQFAPVRKRMMERLTTPAWIIHHFLETLRKDLLRSLLTTSASPAATPSVADSHSPWSAPPSLTTTITTTTDATEEGGVCQSCTHLQCAIIAQYPTDALLPTYQFFKIMLSAFRQKLQPPTYAGSIERRLRGWNRGAASDEDMTKVLLWGGMRQVQHIMQGPKYVTRLAEMQRFVARLDGAVAEAPTPLANSAIRATAADDLKTSSISAAAVAARPKKTPTPPTKSLDLLESSLALTPEHIKVLLGSPSSNAAAAATAMEVLPRAPNQLWLPGARSRILKAAIVAGTVQSRWAIPDCFTFIQDVIADRETRLGESEVWDPNISFENRVEEAAQRRPDGDGDEGEIEDEDAG